MPKISLRDYEDMLQDDDVARKRGGARPLLSNNVLVLTRRQVRLKHKVKEERDEMVS